jgi:hypothetical protein
MNKEKLHGYLVLIGGKATRGRNTHNGALTACRGSEVPTIWSTMKDVDFILKITHDQFGDFEHEVVPIPKLVTETRVNG